ncbi:MAG: type II secretion system protein [Geobacteraceae bacterium]|nr:type II secretion system protein [Geobacteraceae bacterium]MDD3024465.1 type II secretion system protein [Syntrophomonadaceae bacterium]
MNKKGFSLIELVVIVSIIGILLTLGTISFNSWQTKYYVEKQTKEMFTDISAMRLRAIHTKRLHRLTFLPNSYSCQSYAPEDEALAAGVTVMTKFLKYKLVNEDGTPFVNAVIDFNSRGFAESERNFRVSSTTNDAPFDCIIVSAGQTNMGKMKEGTCYAK